MTSLESIQSSVTGSCSRDVLWNSKILVLDQASRDRGLATSHEVGHLFDAADSDTYS